MKKYIIFTIITILLMITACSKQTDNVQLANPAAENCISLGGTLESRTSPEGEYAVCKKDNIECEEWALFRNECSLDKTAITQGPSFEECKELGGLVFGPTNNQCAINSKVILNDNSIINLENCDSYYDGCNTCMLTEDKTIGGCTRMACEQANAPECRIKEPTEENIRPDFTNSYLQDMCELNNGTWLDEQKECEYISKETCDQISGIFNECGSACRNNPEAEACTMQCVPFCKLDSESRESNCESNNGSFNKLGMAQIEQCNLKTNDFNTACTDSTECEGMCMQPGVCSEWSINFGCIDILESNNPVTLCID